MDQLDDYDFHPARELAKGSLTAVEAGDKAAWLALFADDAVVADPIGPSMFDPDGTGHRGTEAIAAFYDATIGMGHVTFDVRESFACGNECANVMTITTAFPDGTRALVDCVATYYATPDGSRIQALRAYWEMDKLRMKPAAEG